MGMTVATHVSISALVHDVDWRLEERAQVPRPVRAVVDTRACNHPAYKQDEPTDSEELSTTSL